MSRLRVHDCSIPPDGLGAGHGQTHECAGAVASNAVVHVRMVPRR
jgi:hypothetical protein